MYKKKQRSDADSKDEEMDIKKIMEDIEFLGSSHMTWKERKELENRKVVSLGGKPPKNQRLPLSIARVTMKKQKAREEKMQQERMILGRFGGKLAGGAKRSAEKRRPENRVLKSSEGHFRNGVLDVKHILRPGLGLGPGPSIPRGDNSGSHLFNEGKKKKGRGSGKKNRGKKKGGGRKRH